MDGLLDLCDILGSYAGQGSPYVVVVIRWCSTDLESHLLHKYLCPTKRLLTKYLLNLTCYSLFEIRTNYDVSSLFSSILKIARRHAHDAKQKHVNTLSTPSGALIHATWWYCHLVLHCATPAGLGVAVSGGNISVRFLYSASITSIYVNKKLRKEQRKKQTQGSTETKRNTPGIYMKIYHKSTKLNFTYNRHCCNIVVYFRALIS